MYITSEKNRRGEECRPETLELVDFPSQWREREREGERERELTNDVYMSKFHICSFNNDVNKSANLLKVVIKSLTGPKKI